MRIENKRGYPRSWINAVQDAYDLPSSIETISATQLDVSPKVRLLTLRHREQIVVDAEDKGHALFGEAMHYVIAKSQDDSYITEQRVQTVINGKILSGKPDLYDKVLKRIEDYKTASVWTWIFNSDKWEKQLNIYAYLFRKITGREVLGLIAMIIFKDWYSLELVKYDNYPPFNPYMVEIPLWKEEDQIKYIEERINEHKRWELCEDDEIPECSEKERFKQDDTWAIYHVGKENAARAIRVFDSLQAAESFVQRDEQKYTVVQRIGYDKKCHHYCQCREFCHYWKRINDCGKCIL